MLRHGASVRHVQEMLGHASLMTTERYLHVEISDLRRVHQRCHPRERRMHE
jgi:site-specific recombinase XerD